MPKPLQHLAKSFWQGRIGHLSNIWAWIRCHPVTQEKIGRNPPFKHVWATRSEPPPAALSASGAIGRHHRQIADVLEGLGGPGDGALATAGLMGEPRPVGLAPARAGVHAGEQAGDADEAGGRGESLVSSDFGAETGAGVSVDHDRVRPQANAYAPSRRRHGVGAVNADKITAWQPSRVFGLKCREGAGNLIIASY